MVPFAEMWVDLESVTQSEVSQKEKKQIPVVNAYMWNLKNAMGYLIHKAEMETQTQRTDRTNMRIPRGKAGWDEFRDWD